MKKTQKNSLLHSNRQMVTRRKKKKKIKKDSQKNKKIQKPTKQKNLRRGEKNENKTGLASGNNLQCLTDYLQINIWSQVLLGGEWGGGSH